MTNTITDTCPVCGDTMTDTHDNLRPTWSDAHDDLLCWWCANHTAPAVEVAAAFGDGAPAVFVSVLAETSCENGPFVQAAPLTTVEARRLAAELLRAADIADELAAQTSTDRPAVSRNTTERMREAAHRLRFEHIATGAHDSEARELDLLADWLDANR